MRNEVYKRVKKQVEEDLRNYPYYLISIETPGLGTAIRPDAIIHKSINPSDPITKALIQEEYKRTVVNAIGYIYDKLDDECKKVVDLYYFRDMSGQDIILELMISKNKFYKIKQKALDRFIVGLGYSIGEKVG